MKTSNYITSLLHLFVITNTLGLPHAKGRIYSLEEITQQVTGGDFEPATRLSEAKVELADYGAITDLFEVSRDTPKELLDQWLLKCCAYVTNSQLESQSSKISDREIPVKGESFPVFRPNGFGRATVTETSLVALGKSQKIALEVKGSGGLNPSAKDHLTGLFLRSEAIKGYNYQKLVKSIFLHDGQNLKTADTLALINTGFRGYNTRTGKFEEAWIMVRKAVPRGNSKFNAAGIPYCKENAHCLPNWSVELLLREYGVSSTIYTTDTGDLPKRRGINLRKGMYLINLQQNNDGEYLDFSHFASIFSQKLPLAIAGPEFPEATYDDFLKKPNIHGYFNSRDPAAIAHPFMLKQHGRQSAITVDPCFNDKVTKLPRNRDYLGQHCRALLPFLNKLKLRSDFITSLDYCRKF